uniref:PX domain-containing protein n=1 Tax=Setaria digitata TaxID=48799 RepID=A0A915PN41_9BILA
MPVLLCDASSCCSELGRILYANPNEWNVHMNIVSTNTMSSFFTSHIEYQMSVCAIPCNSLATDIRFFDMWTRFRDVKRLWEQLADLHKKLHLHGSFPQFTEGVIFGNQSAPIIGQRTSSITTFLNYVLAHPVLRQSKVLQDYFEPLRTVEVRFWQRSSNTFLQKAEEILKPLNHKDPLEPQRHCSSTKESSITSFRANTARVSNPLATVSGATAQLHIQSHPVLPAVVQGNSITHTQEKNIAYSAPQSTSATTNQTCSGYSYVLPTYYCFAVSQQPRFTQSTITDNGTQQHSCS